MADAASTLSEGILVTFTGSTRLDPAKDVFNYYLSQLRIHVEMAFGMLVNKFHMLSGTIVRSQDRALSILIACARLHNYIIHEDKSFGDKFDSFPNDIADLEDVSTNIIAPRGMTYLPVVPNDEFQQYDGMSCTTEAIVEFIWGQDIRRPTDNLERKQGNGGKYCVLS